MRFTADLDTTRHYEVELDSESGELIIVGDTRCLLFSAEEASNLRDFLNRHKDALTRAQQGESSL